MAVTHCFTPLLGKRMRITRLTDCGAPLVAGTANAFIVTSGFISVTLSSEVEDGAEIIQKNAAGNIVVNEKRSASFKRFNVEMTLIGVNPSLLSYISNATVYNDYAGDQAGFKVSEGPITNKFALELWTGLAGQDCVGANEASGYIVLPYIQAGVLGNIEVNGENAVNASLTGASTRGGNAWNTGPYQVVFGANGTTPSKIPTALNPYDHLLMIDTALALPPESCNPQPAPTGGTTTTSTTGTTTTTTTL